MSNQKVIYSEISQAKYSKRQQMKPESKNSSISDTEQEIIYVELNLHNISPDLQGNDKKSYCKDFPSLSGRLLTGILGIICLVLTASLITVTVVDITPRHHCHRCRKDWFMNFNNCYYISTERKSWTESRMACAAENSRLLYIDSEEEMDFMSFFNVLAWTGFSGNSTLSSKLFSVSPEKDKECRTLNYFNKKFSSEPCSDLKIYVCKHKAQ